jgi:hypothetical protein
MSDWNETVQRLNEVGNLRSEITRLRAALATARAEERERCAKVAESRLGCMPVDRYDEGSQVAAKEIAAAIRAMKDDTNG